MGQASAYLSLEATARGLHVHQMIGILRDRGRELYGVPDDVPPLTGLAIGYLGNPHALADKTKARDLAPRSRKSISEFVFSGRWGDVANLADPD